jgi:hypothetical protein
MLQSGGVSYYSDISHTCMHVCDNGMERLGTCQGIIAMHSFLNISEQGYTLRCSFDYMMHIVIKHCCAYRKSQYFGMEEARPLCLPMTREARSLCLPMTRDLNVSRGDAAGDPTARRGALLCGSWLS